MDGEKPCRSFPKLCVAEETLDLSVGGVVSDAVQVEGAQNGAIHGLEAAWGVQSAEEGV
jgi:hypothetical protein